MSKPTVLSAPLFLTMLRSGAANITNNREIINNLNVFPVPDGDTGDNMSMTINSALSDPKITTLKSLPELLDFTAKAMLLGARGNSGVILSRIFAGLAKGLTGHSVDSPSTPVTASVSEFSRALQLAKSEAYSAVPEAKEGTMLTVIKDAADSVKNPSEIGDFEQFFTIFLNELKSSVERTPDLLPTLKESGVVDSGGVGLVYIFEGFLLAIQDTPVEPLSPITTHAEQAETDYSLFSSTSEMTYEYCTEFLLRLQTLPHKNQNFHLDDFKKSLSSFGNSIVAFQDDTLIKVHIHTFHPGEVFTFAQTFGEFLKLKVENMNIQHNGVVIKNSYNPPAARKPSAIVAVANGSGIIKSLTDMGVDYVIDGGQSMNPSTEDFLNAFDSVNAQKILVYPSNGNVILAANQASDLYKKSEIVVLPTKNLGETIISISTLDPSAAPADLLSSAKNLPDTVVTGTVARSAKSTSVGDLSISVDDYIGYTSKTILISHPSRREALLDLCKALHITDYDLAILYAGQSVDESEFSEIQQTLQSKYPCTEFTFFQGNQPIEDYIIILN